MQNIGTGHKKIPNHLSVKGLNGSVGQFGCNAIMRIGQDEVRLLRIQ